MRIETRATNFDLTEGAREAARRHVHFALNRFAPRVQSVAVVFSRMNGSRGGANVSCRLRIRGRDGWVITVSDVDWSPLRAIACAAGRAGRSVARHVDRLLVERRVG